MNKIHEPCGQDPDPSGICTGRNLYRVGGASARRPIKRYLSSGTDPDGIDNGRIRRTELLWNKNRRTSSTGCGSRWDPCWPTGWTARTTTTSGSSVAGRNRSESDPPRRHRSCIQPAIPRPIYKEGSPNRATPPLKSYGKNQVSLPRPSHRATFRAARAG